MCAKLFPYLISPSNLTSSASLITDISQSCNIHGHKFDRRLRSQLHGSGRSTGFSGHAQLHQRAPGDGGWKWKARASPSQRPSPTRGDGDEEWHFITAWIGTVPQDLHSKTWTGVHFVRGHRRLYSSGLTMYSPRIGSSIEWTIWTLRSVVQW